MTVSGSGGVTPNGEGWDPSIMADVHTSPSNPASASSVDANPSMQELVSSGVGGDYAASLYLNKGRYRKTQEKTSNSLSTRLRSSFSKIKANTQSFLKTFGTRASRISARMAERSGEGASLLPSNMDLVRSKGNRISPDMQAFFLDASGFSNQNFQVKDLTTESLGSTAIGPAMDSSAYLAAEDSLATGAATTALAVTQMQRQITNVSQETVNAWTVSRGSEMLSSLLDANVESSSLLRRAPTILQEGMIDLSSTSQESQSAFLGNNLFNEEDVISGYPSENSSSLLLQSLTTANKTSSKETEEEQVIPEEIAAALAKMMSSVLTSGKAAPVYTAQSAVGGAQKTGANMRFSGTVSHAYLNHSESHVERENRRDSAFSQGHHETGIVTDLHKEAPQRFFNARGESHAGLGNNNSVFGFSVLGNHGNNNHPIPAHGREALYNSEHLLGSAFLFSSQTGISVLLPVSRSMSEYKQKLDAFKGPGGPPDPLIYQYRNVSIDPPLVLNPPTVFGSSTRFFIQGKPEAAGVFDDQDDSQGSSGGDEDQEREGKNKERSKTDFE